MVAALRLAELSSASPTDGLCTNNQLLSCSPRNSAPLQAAVAPVTARFRLVLAHFKHLASEQDAILPGAAEPRSIICFVFFPSVMPAVGEG